MGYNPIFIAIGAWIVIPIMWWIGDPPNPFTWAWIGGTTIWTTIYYIRRVR